MVKEIQYTNIRRVLDDLLDHPMLANLTLEQVIRHALKFISRHGYAKLYEDRIADVEIHDFRGLLPCDLISITQVKDLKNGICLRAMTDSFPKGMQPEPHHDMHHHPHHAIPKEAGLYIPPVRLHYEEPSFKTQGQIIYTSFPEGMVQVAYRAIPVDEDGFPLLIDNETYLDALEGYIKMKVFEVKFDQQKIPSGVFQNAQQQYYASARLLQSEFTLPSPSEMRSIAAAWNRLIPSMRDFDKSFRHLGDQEYLKKQ